MRACRRNTFRRHALSAFSSGWRASGCGRSCFSGLPQLSAAVSLRPSARRPSEPTWIATLKLCHPFYHPCERSSWCSFFPARTRSSCRHPLLCSPLPMHAVPPRGWTRRASHSLSRCAGLSAFAYRCRTTYRLVAWSCSPLSGIGPRITAADLRSPRRLARQV